jgi:hypothetical protein
VNGNHLTSYLALGDKFAMNVKEENVEGVDFYIFMYTKPMYTLQSPYTCAWGQQFEACDTIVVGRYYQRWGHFKNSYVFLRKYQVVVLDVYNVWAIKFPMVRINHQVQGNDLVYTLFEHVEDGIREAIDVLN